MTDLERVKEFEEYMVNKGYSKEKVEYNTLVVKLLITQVLYFFQETISSIDTYCFEEFTDMITLIDSQMGGRDGIPKMLDAMLDLTEFLKEKKLIKGGKIAHYKRMFSHKEYYIDKYDKMTGKKDNSKTFIKEMLSYAFPSSVLKLLEDINVYNFSTIDLIDKILNDIPIKFGENGYNTKILIEVLINLDLLQNKDGIYEPTKKGRALSRINAEERYTVILYLLLYYVDWNSIIEINNLDAICEFNSIVNMLATVFHDGDEVTINMKETNNIEDDKALIEIASNRFRIAKIESFDAGRTIMDICFIGMGLIEVEVKAFENIVYKSTQLGKNVFKLIYNDYMFSRKLAMERIIYMIKNKKYEEAESSIIEFLGIYGESTGAWDILGQLLLIKKKYKYAYIVLKHAYENSSKRGKTAKSVLYHLVLCCQKLKLKEDLDKYEEKLKRSERA